ncbi:MBL fold metallo-hydrolase [Pseudoalteromonas sp. MMG022]|uniref:MBL fold metallo-hydrolase n=1 Tax=Pseudoalteromonas sp. MMG022 TaxID=2909978 RepID=UPI001F2D8F8C|nr:MBL fold metallo-hydrolase [Pseudoalteromonas sp. MMG022]MCF6437196.1 MBL fold metallo-hydrolase [Pseudoalteromonas sp. MMG022]
MKAKSNIRVWCWGIAMLLCPISCALLADDKAAQVIKHAVNAYGGEKLIQLKSMTLHDEQLHFSQWQSGHALQGERVSYLSEQRLELAIDFANQRKVFKRATMRLVGGHGSDSPTVMHRLYVDGKGYGIDHALGQYNPAERVNFDNADIGQSEWLDTLIVKSLFDHKAASKWMDIAYIQGQAHDVLSVHSGTQQEYTLYINQNTGYLTRLLKELRGQRVSVDFLHHKQSDGLTWAQRVFAGTEQGPLFHSNARRVAFNSVRNTQFDLPVNYTRRPSDTPMDVSKQTIKTLASGVYYVGKEWSYTLFIDVGDHFISAGAWQMDEHSQDWQNNVALLRETTKIDKPIKQHIVTHHHTDHLMGVKDVLEHGAALVVHANDVVALQSHLKMPLTAEQLIKVSKQGTLAGGKVQLFDVPNSHANHNLVVYLPEQKILFSEDMFGSSMQVGFDSPSRWPDIDAYHRLAILMNKVDALGIKVEQFVSSHHARVLFASEIKHARSVPLVSKQTLLERVF